MAAPRPTLDNFLGLSLTHPMLITAFLHIWPEGHREPCDEVGSLSPVERIVGFKPVTFRFWFQRLNPLGHTLQSESKQLSTRQENKQHDWKTLFKTVKKKKKKRKEKKIFNKDLANEVVLLAWFSFPLKYYIFITENSVFIAPPLVRCYE